MKMRRYIYLTLLIVAAFITYQFGNSNTIAPPENISQQAVMKDFADLNDNKDIPAGTLGGTYYTTEIFFPDDYIGEQGDEFYVTMEDGHVMLTQKYIIQDTGAEGKSSQLSYKLKDNWENFKPPAGKFESYRYDGKTWTKVSEINK